ncbi:MAG: TerB family tellurite resistance protein [Sulfurovum sp.]|nr:TerB family tellurite resistance protein [Sulfurovum sp.]
MFDFIIFAIVVYVLYRVFKNYVSYKIYSSEAFKNFAVSHEAVAKSDLGLFVALVAKVAKADGRVDALEAELVSMMFDDISKVFPEPTKTRQILKDIFNSEKLRSDNTEQIALAFAQSLRRKKAQQIQFMGFLIQLAFVDGEVSSSEDKVLQTIAEALEFDPKLYHEIFAKFESMMQNVQPKVSLDDAYTLLGVSASDDMNTIKNVYRKLVRKYHPDIIMSQGKSEDYMEEATAKTQEFNMAYEMIKKARN